MDSKRVKTVTTKLLKMYGVSQEVSRKADDLSQMNTEEVEFPKVRIGETGH